MRYCSAKKGMSEWGWKIIASMAALLALVVVILLIIIGIRNGSIQHTLAKIADSLIFWDAGRV